jgi:hypothetical protein
MKENPPPGRRPNPLYVGAIGVLLLLGGYLSMRHSGAELRLLLQGRIAFYLGLGVVLLALGRWVYEARQPDEPAEPPREDDPEEDLP